MNLANKTVVLTLVDDTIAALTLFAKPDGLRLFPAFGLPLALPQADTACTSPPTGISQSARRSWTR